MLFGSFLALFVSKKAIFCDLKINGLQGMNVSKYKNLQFWRFLYFETIHTL